MANKNLSRVHWSFWLIGFVALIWNLMGSANIVMQMIAPNFEAMPQWWRDVVASRPIWTTIAMMVAVFGGLLGCLAILFRRAVALPLFILPLLGTAITMAHAAGVPGAGTRQIVEAVVMPVVVGIFLIWYAWVSRGRGWIG